MKHDPTPTDDPIVCVHIGRSTWQGPTSEAPKLSPSRMTPASAEPVAYQVAMSDGRWGTIFHHPDKPLGDHRPLYAHPPTPAK